jgi:hypothetical protein
MVGSNNSMRILCSTSNIHQPMYYSTYSKQRTIHHRPPPMCQDNWNHQQCKMASWWLWSVPFHVQNSLGPTFSYELCLEFVASTLTHAGFELQRLMLLFVWAAMCDAYMLYILQWMRILLTFTISYVSWVVATITTKSSHCFQKCNRSPGCRFCIMVCWNFEELIIYLSTPIISSWWSQWVIMGACHSYLWWRWWSDT